MDFSYLDSITDTTPDDVGKIGISGSHGGLYAATYASRAGLRAVVLNDAGIGFEDAGIAGVIELDSVQMAGVTVAASSAEIGSAKETLAHGVISYVNNTAASLGLKPGDVLKDCVDKLLTAPAPSGVCDAVEEARFDYSLEGQDGLTILCVDSAAIVSPSDEGRVIVTGSHGGLIGGNPDRACKAQAKLVVFNDAGGGKNEIGYSRLPALDTKNIAAMTLDCMSCRIGDAHSALQTGVVSRVNQSAASLGFKAKVGLMDQLKLYLVD